MGSMLVNTNLNNMLSGVVKAGELTVISAGSKVGKSVVMDAMANPKTYPDGSVGHYTCECSCGTWFTGHKRDRTCPECESKIPVQQDLPL